MKTASIALFAIAYLGMLAFAFKFLLAKRYFPYHEQVTGQSWNDLDEGIRVVIGALMRLFGGSMLAIGLTGLWLTWLHAVSASVPIPLVLLPGILTAAFSLWVSSTIIGHGGTGAPRAQVAVLTAIALAAAIAGYLA